jgi:hypothetical protein
LTANPDLGEILPKIFSGKSIFKLVDTHNLYLAGITQSIELQISNPTSP